MNTLEDLVRETLADRARDVDGIDLTAPRSSTRRGHRWVAIATVAAVAAAILVAVVLIAPWRDAGDRNAVGDVPTPPAGMQWVSYHGLSLTVPAVWKLNPGLSCDPPPDAVFVSLGDTDGSVTVACGSFSDGPATPQPQTTTVVSLAVLRAGNIAGARTDIDGHAAYRNDSSPSGGQARYSWPLSTQIGIPDAGVAIHVNTTSEAALSDLLGRVEFTPVDHYGCSALPPRTAEGTSGPVSVAGATAGVVCEYENPATSFPVSLVGSRALTAEDLHTLSAAVSAAEPAPEAIGGTGRLGPNSGLHVYHLIHADGSESTVTVDLSGNPVIVTDDRHVGLLSQGPTDPVNVPNAYP